jgi:glycosyltransferase involved in cell wall biosynthesis
MLAALAAPAGAKITVLRNGVDLEYFAPVEDIPRDPATLVISGKMSYHANVAMALQLVQEIMPKVWAKRPETRVCIVGKDPPKTIRQFQNPNITVTGTVNDRAHTCRHHALH